MNILNNITNETINIPELIGLEIGKLIKNKNLLNKYYNDGYKINIDNDDAHLIITYNNDKYDIYITQIFYIGTCIYNIYITKLF